MLEKDMRKQIIEQWEGVVRFTPIESPGTQRSIPDMQARSRTADWWIELKQIDVIRFLESKVSDPISIPWRAGQRTWLREHDAKNGNVALIISRGSIYYILQDMSNILHKYENHGHLINSCSYHGIIWNAPKDLWERK